MPNYDFKCDRCKQTFEKMVRSDITAVSCKYCHGVGYRQPCAPAFKVRGGTPKGTR